MARTNLGDLLGKVGDAGPTSRPAVPAPADHPPATRAAPTSPVEVPTQPDEGPRFLRFVRKDTRIREDQQAALTIQARRLNRAKGSAGSRITENSLIRVAIDLLLDRIDLAAGADEDAIRASVRR